MTVPAVVINTLNGNLGAQSPTGRKPIVVVGPGTLGTAETPTPVSKASIVKSTFGYGSGPECSCYLTARGLKVIHVRADATTPGDCDTIDVTGVTGTSVATYNGTPAPNDDYDVWTKVVAGGTIGTAGITYQVSLDGGYNWGPITALGTATSINIGTAYNVGTLTIDFAAGTLVANDLIKARCNGPECTATDVTDAMAAVELLSTDWEMLVLTTSVTAAVQAILDASMLALEAKGRMCWWVGSVRVPDAGENDATYQTALSTELASLVTDYGAVFAGSAQVQSSMPGRANYYRRRPTDPVAALLGRVNSEVDIAQILSPGGALPGVAIRDVNGNILHHDELDQPGLDDLRLGTLRTWAGRNGVYVNNPRIRSAEGADFEFVPHRRVMNDFKRAQVAYLATRLSKDIYVNPDTGFILEDEALEIEAGLNSLCAGALRGKVSAFTNVVARDDNLLSTKTMTVTGSIVPKAYPKLITVTNGFTNPALSVQAA